ncbi:MAG: CpaE family protein [bacterium]|jgi:Flp pilus assembly CpaE family ATPase
MTCLAFIQNPEVIPAVNAAITNFWNDGQLIPGDPVKQMGSQWGAVSQARILLVDLSYVADPVIFVNSINTKLRYDQIVIYIGTQNDIPLFRKITENPLADYLVTPITGQDILNAAAHLSDRKMDLDQKQKKNYRGKIMGFVGSHGGVGTSSLAAAFAWSLAEELKKKVLLIDMDMNLGIQSFLFDVKPRFGLQDVMDSPSRIEAGFIDDLCIKKTANLHLICSEPSLTSFALLKEEGLIRLLEVVEKNYDYIIYDMPRSLVVKMASFIERLSYLFITTDSTVIGLRDTILLSNQAIFYKNVNTVGVVLNRVKANNPDLIAARDFDARVKVKVVGVIPDATDLLLKSINESKPVAKLDPQSDYTQAVHALIEKSTDETGFAPVQASPFIKTISTVLHKFKK